VINAEFMTISVLRGMAVAEPTLHFSASLTVKAFNRGVRGEVPAEIAKKNIAKILNARRLI